MVRKQSRLASRLVMPAKSGVYASPSLPVSQFHGSVAAMEIAFCIVKDYRRSLALGKQESPGNVKNPNPRGRIISRLRV